MAACALAAVFHAVVATSQVLTTVTAVPAATAKEAMASLLSTIQPARPWRRSARSTAASRALRRKSTKPESSSMPKMGPVKSPRLSRSHRLWTEGMAVSEIQSKAAWAPSDMALRALVR